MVEWGMDNPSTPYSPSRETALALCALRLPGAPGQARGLLASLAAEGFLPAGDEGPTASERAFSLTRAGREAACAYFGDSADGSSLAQACLAWEAASELRPADLAARSSELLVELSAFFGAPACSMDQASEWLASSTPDGAAILGCFWDRSPGGREEAPTPVGVARYLAAMEERPGLLSLTLVARKEPGPVGSWALDALLRT